MKIVIVGYGKMGKSIEQIAENLSIPISKTINSYKDLINYNFKNNEIAIEFTKPSSCLKNIKTLASKGVNIVCGTTGWFKNINQIKKLVYKNNIGFIYGSNFSIGTNIFWKIIKETSLIIDKFDHYDIMGHEIHHNNKKDSPSGTALTTAQILINNIKRKKQVVINRVNRKMRPEEIHFSSSRCGNIIGKHEIIIDSPNDSIKISHTSKWNTSYAEGAIKCAKWIKNKNGFYNIINFIDDLINE